MEKNADGAAVARNAARGAMVAERAARREGAEIMREVTLRTPRGRLTRRLSAVLQDQEGFDDWVMEKGEGATVEEAAPRFMRWFCAQVAAGVTARVLCDHYMQDDGLLGGFLAEKPERLEQYYRAQVWSAEGLVDDALEEAWDDGLDVVRSKLRVTTNMQIAGKYNRARFGEEKAVGVPGVPVINFIMGVGSSLTVANPLADLPEKQVFDAEPPVDDRQRIIQSRVHALLNRDEDTDSAVVLRETVDDDGAV